MSDDLRPPKAKFKLTLTIEGNTHDEVQRELESMVRGYPMDIQFGERDSFHIIGGRSIRELACQNPDMTPERYRAEQDEWWQARKAARDVG
jgi:hypothetical protein